MKQEDLLKEQNRNLGYLLSSVGAGGIFFLTYYLNASILSSPVGRKDAFTGFVISALLGVISADHPKFPLISAAGPVLALESFFMGLCAIVPSHPYNQSTVLQLAFVGASFAAISMYLKGCAVTRESMDGQATV
jgi:hypothetical protein